ncbi:MAG: peptide chain release factor 1 [bacterium]
MKLKFEPQLEELEEHLDHLQTLLNSPDELADSSKFQEISLQYSQLKPVVDSYRKFKQLREEYEESKQLLAESSGEMAELAREEMVDLEQQLDELAVRLKELLIPPDPDSKRNVILEVRAGTGGEEAALFAADLFRMYSRYAGERNWKIEPLDITPAAHGGYKQLVAEVKGKDVYGCLQYESGIHRVQRVPETESGGRIHTSAATVAVLPEARDIDIQINPEDLKVDTYRASGAGGQHVNKTDSAVRITHQPTGNIAQCQDERSQHKNKARALKILRSRLYEQEKSQRDEQRREKRKNQVGSGDRSEKIRTYNFPQSRVTDHRINLTLYNLEEILDGNLEELITALREADRLEKLEELEESEDLAGLVG